MPTRKELYRRLSEMRRFPSPSPWYRLYLVVFLSSPALLVAIDADVEVAPGRSVVLLEAVGRWLPVVLAGGLLTVARVGTWAGLAIPERAEVAWIFSSPVSRSSLLRPRIRRGLGLGAAVGAVVGYLGGLLLLLEVDPPVASALSAAVGAGALYGLFAAALIGWIQASEARAQAVLRWSPALALVLVTVGVVVAIWPPVAGVVSWSGPWGWTSKVALAGVAGGGPGWQTAAALTAVVAVAAAGWTLVTAHRMPVEELARRADAVSGVRAALFFLDVRQAAELRRSAQRTLRRAPSRWIRPPRRASLIIPWTDLRELVRAPGWVLTIGATIGIVSLAATSRAVQAVREPLAVLIGLGVVGSAIVTMQLVAALRTETSYPFADRHLPWRAARVAWMHLLVPTAVLTLAVIGAWAGARVAGTGVDVVVPGLAFSLLAVPLLILTAALGASLPPASVDLLMQGDAGVLAFWSRVFVGPQLTAAVVFAPPALVLYAPEPLATTDVMVTAVFWSMLVSLGLGYWFDRRLRTIPG
ncbi:MAG: DUF6297 family protein [Nitriliruptoraceae bacterium]